MISGSKYCIGRLIGEGGHSNVYIGAHKYKRKKVAIKIYSPYICPEAIEDEARILQIIKSINPKRCIIFEEIFYSDRYCIVTELLGNTKWGDTLCDLIEMKYRPLSLIKRVVYDILSGLLELQQCNIIHADLKPANVFLCRDGGVKIGDFGNAVFNRHCPETYIQTRTYRSPESILKLTCYYSTDLWSLGCITYELITGSILFDLNEREHYHLRHSPHFPVEDLNLQRKRLHLEVIQEVCGQFNYSFIRRSKSFGVLFDHYGQLKGRSHCKSCSHRFKLEELRDFDGGYPYKLMYKMLRNDPRRRPGVKQLLDDPWFRY